MNCSSFWNCLDTQFPNALIALIYQSGIIFILPFMTLAGVVYFALQWRQLARFTSRIRLGRSLLAVAMTAGFVLSIPAFIFRSSPALLRSVLGVASEATIFQLHPDIFSAGAVLLSGTAWAALGGVLIQAVSVAWPINHIRDRAVPSLYATGSLSNATKDRLLISEELTPTPDEFRPANSSGVATVPLDIEAMRNPERKFDPEATIPPPSDEEIISGDLRYMPPPQRVAWLELEWIGGERVLGTDKRWRLDILKRPVVIGRAHPESVRLPSRITLTDKDANVSREHVVINADLHTGYTLKNTGKSDVRVNNRIVKPNTVYMEPLQSGTTIAIEQYELVFRELSTPTLRYFRPANPKDRVRTKPVSSRVTIGGKGSELELDLEEQMADIYFDLKSEKPGYVLAPKPGMNHRIRINGNRVSDETILLSTANNVIVMDDWNIEFLVDDIDY